MRIQDFPRGGVRYNKISNNFFIPPPSDRGIYVKLSPPPNRGSYPPLSDLFCTTLPILNIKCEHFKIHSKESQTFFYSKTPFILIPLLLREAYMFVINSKQTNMIFFSIQRLYIYVHATNQAVSISCLYLFLLHFFTLIH